MSFCQLDTNLDGSGKKVISTEELPLPGWPVATPLSHCLNC